MSADDRKPPTPEWTPARVLCHVAHHDGRLPAEVRRELLELADDLERWTRRLRELAGHREVDS
jgi:hypothetical protein